MFKPALSADVRVTVKGLSHAHGNAHIAIYSGGANFPKKNGMLDQAIVPILTFQTQWIFKGLDAGHYAVAVFHDENSDGKFNQGFMGLPLEDFGFSMGARAFISAPEFSDAAFFVPVEGKDIIIDLSD